MAALGLGSWGLFILYATNNGVFETNGGRRAKTINVG